MMRDISILFLTLYPEIAPSPRYRVFQLVPELEKLNIRCDVRPLLDARQFRATRQPGRLFRKSLMVGSAAAKRLRLALNAGRYDAVYLLKGALPYGPALIEQVLARSSTPLIFDFDDAIHIHKPSVNFGAFDRLKSTNRVAKTVEMADHVVVPNDYLADYSRQFNDCVTVVPEAENTERLQPRAPHQGRARTIGWVGSPSTAKYLKTITPALQEVSRRYPDLSVRVVGGHYEADGVRTELVDWAFENESQLFQGLDIGLMPLPLEEWSKGKSGCKMRQYMASGVPGVATNIGYNQELVAHGQTGFLATSQEDWIHALTRLIEDSTLRNSIAKAARSDVVERFRIPKIAEQLARVLRDVVASSHQVAVKESLSEELASNGM